MGHLRSANDNALFYLENFNWFYLYYEHTSYMGHPRLPLINIYFDYIELLLVFCWWYSIVKTGATGCDFDSRNRKCFWVIIGGVDKVPCALGQEIFLGPRQ